MQEAKAAIITFLLTYGLQALGALVILAAGCLLAGWVGRILNRGLEQNQMEPPLRLLLVRFARLLVFGFTLIIALDRFGVPVASLVAGIGVAGVGIGLAMQGMLGNLVAGLLIIFTKPFRVGEYIELLGVSGQVVSIELFSTFLMGGDRSRMMIPNRRIIGEIVHNFGQIRQINVSVGVAYDCDIKAVLSELRALVAKNPRALKDPAPGVGVTSLGDSAINIAVKPWVGLADFGPAQAELYEAILERFRDAHIEIPFPQRDIRMIEKPSKAA